MYHYVSMVIPIIDLSTLGVFLFEFFLRNFLGSTGYRFSIISRLTVELLACKGKEKEKDMQNTEKKERSAFSVFSEEKRSAFPARAEILVVDGLPF